MYKARSNRLGGITNSFQFSSNYEQKQYWTKFETLTATEFDLWAESVDFGKAKLKNDYRLTGRLAGNMWQGCHMRRTPNFQNDSFKTDSSLLIYPNWLDYNNTKVATKSENYFAIQICKTL